MSRGVVLVTGINGFLGTYTALAFLEAGYTIKGTARTAAKAQDWIAHFPAHKASYEYAVVEDLAAPGAFDEAVKGCDIIAHVASPNPSIQSVDNEVDILIPAITGTKNLLAATKREPRIRSVVFTSTLGTVFQPRTHVSGTTYTEADWNPVTYEEARASPNPRVVYGASKTLAERAFWAYIEEEKPAWTGAAILPSGVFDPPIQPLTSLAGLNRSVAFLWDIARGAHKSGLALSASHAMYVSARDVALAHVRAAELPIARGGRYILTAGSFETADLLSIIARNFPTLRPNLPAPAPSPPAASDKILIDASKTTRELGFAWMSLERTVVDTIAALLALEAKFNLAAEKGKGGPGGAGEEVEPVVKF
ncbi:NAD-P-binding protein [Mycena leptocephala]|nr:NAD-P-binding protein [Mycena leptocephala]